jgi:hypothetical protein
MIGSQRIQPSYAGKSAKRVFALDDPRIYLEKMDGRVKPGHDAVMAMLTAVIIRESG